MARYDGSIRINTKIDSKQAQTQLMTLQNQIVKTADKIAGLRSKMDALKGAKIQTQEYKEISSQISKAESEFNKLIEKQEQMQREGRDNGIAWDRINEKMEETGNTIRYAKGELQDLVDSGKAFTLGKDTEKYAKLGQQLKYAENEMSVLAKRQDLLMLKQQKVSDKYNELKKAAMSAFQKMGGSIKSAAIAPLKSLGNAAKNTFSNIGKSANKSSGFFSKFGSRIKELALSAMIFNQVSKIFSSMISGIKEGMGKLASFSDPVKSSISSLQSSLMQLKNSLATAFAPILTAAAPALTALINMASRAATAVGMLIAALTGQKTFTKATKVQEGYADSLGGTAKAAKEANKQLSPLDKLNNMTSNESGGSGGNGGAGGGAGNMFETVDIPSKISNLADMIKAAWEKADFTEIGEMLGTKLKSALESIPWEEIQETASKIGKSIGTLINGFVEVPGLGTTIGNTIGQGINTGIAFAKSLIDSTHFDSIGKFIGDGLNGIVNTIKWADLGAVLGGGINGALQMIENAASTFEWGSLGDGISTSINSAIAAIEPAHISGSINALVKGMLDLLIWTVSGTDFKEIGNKVGDALNGIDWVGIVPRTSTGLSEIVKGMLDLLIGFVEGTDWGQLGIDLWNSLVAAVTGIDWSGLCAKIFELLGAALVGVVTFNAGIMEGIGKTISNLFNSAVEWVKGEIEKSGGNVFLAMLNGIVDIVRGVGSWIKKNIFDPFIKGFKNAFGINGDSKVMAEQGKHIISGLLGGLKNNISSVLEWLKNIPVWFKEKFDEAYKKAQAAFVGIGSWFGQRWKDIQSAFSGITSWFKEKFEGAKQKVHNAFKAIGSWFGQRWKDIQSAFSGITSWFKEKFEGAYKEVTSAFAGIKNFFENVGKNIVNGIIDGIKAIWSTLTGWANDIKELFNIKPTASKGAGVSMVGGGSPKAKAYSPAMASILSMQIPKLATGTVIPPNREFLAVLGDQKHGTNIEAPLSTIEEAVENALRRNGGSGGVREVTVKVPVEIDGRVLFELMKKLDLEQFNRTGRPSFQI